MNAHQGKSENTTLARLPRTRRAGLRGEALAFTALALVGASLLACSSDDSTDDPNVDAGTHDSAVIDTGSHADATPQADGSVSDAGTDGTVNDAAADGTVNDATADGAVNDATADGALNDATVDAALDGGADASDGSTPQALTEVTPVLSALTVASTDTKAQLVALTGTGPDAFYGVTYDASGNLYAVGRAAASTADDYVTVVAKFKSDQTLDTSFGKNGVAVKNLAVGTNGELARGIVLQSSGKIVVAAAAEHVGGADARDRDVYVARFNTDGTLDSTFGTGGVVVLDLSNGEFVPTATPDGGAPDSGTSDAGTDGGADGGAPAGRYYADAHWGLSVYPDDRLVVTGTRKREGIAVSDYTVLRLQKDGARDVTFGTNGEFILQLPNDATGAPVSGSARSATVLADGSIVAGGYTSQPLLFKLNPAGALDTSFGTAGVFNSTVLAGRAECYGAAVQGTKLVTTGYGFRNTGDKTRFVSVRFSANGVVDTTYGPTGDGTSLVDFGGFGDNSRSLQILKNNHVLLVGGGRGTAANVDGALALLSVDGIPDANFGVGGKRLVDLGGPNDFLWGSAQNAAGTQVAIVGLKGADTTVAGANDDAALVILNTSAL